MQKYTYARILGKLTQSPQTSRELTEKLSYVDKNGKMWKPASGTITTKLNMMHQARIVTKIETPSGAGWTINKTAWNKKKDVD